MTEVEEFINTMTREEASFRIESLIERMLFENKSETEVYGMIIRIDYVDSIVVFSVYANRRNFMLLPESVQRKIQEWEFSSDVEEILLFCCTDTNDLINNLVEDLFSKAKVKA